MEVREPRPGGLDLQQVGLTKVLTYLMIDGTCFEICDHIPAPTQTAQMETSCTQAEVIGHITKCRPTGDDGLANNVTL